MKTYILLALMQIAILPAFAQRGGGGGGHSGGGGGGHSGGGGGGRSGGSYSGGRGGSSGPSVSHSFGGRNEGRYNAGGGYSSAPVIRSAPGAHNYGNVTRAPGGYGYNHGYYGGNHGYYGGNRGYYGGYNRGFYGGHGFYGDRFGYGARLFAPAYYRNWAFGWGLGYWNIDLWWQTAFYMDLYNCYADGSYYAPGYYNGYVSDFNYLIQTINNQQGDDSKMAVAKEAIDRRNLSSDQVARIMNCFESDEAKVDFAIYAYPNVTDKKNFYTVNNTFRNPESAQQLGGYLDSQYGSHANPANRGNQGNPGNQNYQNNPGNQQNNPGYQNNPGNQNNQANPPVPANPPVQPQH